MSEGSNETDTNDLTDGINTKFQRIKQLRPLSDSEIKYYYDEFSISNSHNSNAIEGNTFTYDETRMLIKEGLAFSNHDIKEHNEIIGYKKAFDFLYDLTKRCSSIDETIIKKIHSFVVMGDESAGSYRTIQNYIGDMFSIAFTPCSPTILEKSMSDYISILNKDIEKIRSIKESDNIDWLDIFRILAREHISFERIHPFIDGNGRTGRLILIFEMISAGLLPIDIRYEERIHYYSAFKEFEKKIKYTDRPEDKMARLMMNCESKSMDTWLKTFDN